VSSRDGSELLPHGFLNSSVVPLGAAAAHISHDLRTRAAKVLDNKCKWSFISVWDPLLPPASGGPLATVESLLGYLLESQLVGANRSATLMAITVSQCTAEWGLKPVESSCVGREAYCEPVETVMREIDGFVEDTGAANPALHVQDLSEPAIFAAVQGAAVTPHAHQHTRDHRNHRPHYVPHLAPTHSLRRGPWIARGRGARHVH